MFARTLAAGLLLASAAVVHGQVPAPGAVGGRLGSPLGSPFTPDAVFGRPPTPPPEPPANPMLPPAPPPDAAPVDGPPDGGLLPPPPAPVAPPPKVWRGSFDAGLNGATGNSQLLNSRINLTVTRKTDRNLLHTDFLYALGVQDHRTTQDTAILNVRDEILFPGSRWSTFASTNLEYDQLRAYQFLVGAYAGAGYRLIDEGGTYLKLRLGAGAVRQLGAPGARWVPELLFGYDFKHRFSDRQALVSNLDFYPRADDFARFRLRARAAYEIVLDPSLFLFVRLGVQSRYDSDPGPGARRHDLNYFVSMGLSF